MEKVKNSPLGLKEDWKGKFENAFESGLIMVPPNATRFVLAAQMDFEFKEPLWEAVVMDMDEEISMEQIAQMRSGTLDTIEGLPALARPNDTYIVQLGPKRIAAMGPGNRQAVVRWIREVRKPAPLPLSPYLQKAAVYSDKAGSEIIMALDLEGVLSSERVEKYLKSHEKQVAQWQEESKSPISMAELAKKLGRIQGLRIGVRIEEQSQGMMVIDLEDDASSLAPIVKPLLIQILSDSGALINDFQLWNGKAKKNEISLDGTLSKSGLRRLISMIDSPVGSNDVTTKPKTPSSDPAAVKAKKSRDYFRNVSSKFVDLRDDMKNAKNLASVSLFCERYAKRIDRQPILDVDDEVVDYGAFVAKQLRLAAQSVKTMGIQTGVRSAQVTASGGISSGYDYGYRYGANGRYAERAEMKAVTNERRAIGAEEKATAATDVQQLRQSIIEATADMRRKMTQKYRIEF
jgi:hypothetical protein